jgi:hypothetical protein
VEKTKELLKIFGRHERTTKSKKPRLKSDPRQLTLYELGALIVVAGVDAGFDVYTEYKVEVGLTAKKKPRKGSLDCAWFPKGNRKDMLVAWELDAQDVAKGHLEGSRDADNVVLRLGNQLKFDRSGAKMKIQALYSIRGHLLADKPHAKDFFGSKGVEVVSDVQLMSTRLLAIVVEAQHFAQAL